MRHLTQKDLIFIQEWVVTPEDEREFKSQAALSRHLGFTEKTISLAISKLKEPDDLDEEGQIRYFRQKLYDDAVKPGRTGKDKELYGRSRGLFIDKAEHVIKVVSADEIARRNLAAERELEQWRLGQGEEGRQGVEEMQEKPPVLSE